MMTNEEKRQFLLAEQERRAAYQQWEEQYKLNPRTMYMRKWRAEQKVQRPIQLPLKSRLEIRKARYHEIKSKPCTDCGESYPPFVMNLDHVRGEKIGNISKLFKKSDEIFLAEIAKTELVCANCHRYRSQERVLGKIFKRKKRKQNQKPELDNNPIVQLSLFPKKNSIA